jgi:putative cardiolipin synthase
MPLLIRPFRAGHTLAKAFLLIALAASTLVAGCSSGGMKEDIVKLPPSHALPPATTGVLAEVAAGITAQHGEEYSGFRVLDPSFSGLYWRLALIDSAVSSLDIQTYLWYPDVSGRLILERAVLAAQRGVKVRLIVDDLLLQGHDQLIANLEAQPNIEFRIFNPWTERGSILNRAGQMLAEMERLNSRMHDKLLIADGRAAVIGGRNIGDHYFGLNEVYNFHDTDLLGVGHIGSQANEFFDSFWNSKWVVSAQNLITEPDEAAAQKQWQNILDATADAPQLERFPREPKDWTAEILAQADDLRIGRSKMVYDEASADQIQQNVVSSMFNFFGMAKEELLVMNAYIIPGQKAVDFLQGLSDSGVDVRILTNSLATHDVPAVNSHYEPWRDDLIRAGVELFELRPDAAIKPTVVDVAPVDSEFIGLHSKSSVVDGRYIFVGSMNLDPRSSNINTEMGVFVDSPALAADMKAIILRDMSPENAWHLKLNEDGDVYWEDSNGILTQQPARNGMQRVMNQLMKLGPKEQY